MCGHTDVILVYMHILFVLYVSLVICMFKNPVDALKITWVVCAFHHVTATILNKGKEGRPDEVTAIIAMDDDVTTTILTKNKSGKLVAIYTQDILLLFSVLSLNSTYWLYHMWCVLDSGMLLEGPTTASALHNSCFIYVWVHACDF